MSTGVGFSSLEPDSKPWFLQVRKIDKSLFSFCEEWFHRNDTVLFCRSAPFVHLVMLAFFTVKNRLSLYYVAVIPAESREWELVCVLRTPPMALFPKFLSAAACLPTPECSRSCTSVRKVWWETFCRGAAGGDVAVVLEPKCNLGSGIDGLEVGWWRTSCLKAGCIQLWSKVIIRLDFGNPNCGIYFSVDPTTVFVLLIIFFLQAKSASKLALYGVCLCCFPDQNTAWPLNLHLFLIAS